MPTIDPEFITEARKIEQYRFRNHSLLIIDDDEENFEEEEIDEITRRVRNRIATVKDQIRTRIAEGIELRGGHRWNIANLNANIVYSDLEMIIEELAPVCESCMNEISSVYYSADVQELGRATIGISTGADNHEVDNTEATGDYTYRCEECETQIDPYKLELKISEPAWHEIVRFGQEMIGTTNVALPNEQQDTRIPRITQIAQEVARQRANRQDFPEGRQLQRDINAHGPNGPQMKMGKKNKITYSEPTDYVLRETRSWYCDNCETENNGNRVKCTQCSRGKFERIKEIKI